jgi:hypothetical protein
MILGPAAKVVDEYREAHQQIRAAMWEIVAAQDADRSPQLDEGALLALLIDHFAIMEAADARRFLALARDKKLQEDNLHRILLALP